MRRPIVPQPAQRLTWWRKLVIVLEILLTYARIRWLFRDENAIDAMPRIRSGRWVPFSGSAERMYGTGLRLGRIVNQTLGPLPYDTRCLFSSLTLGALLHRRGIETKLVIAVRPQPFAAHAWVEHAGRPLLPPSNTDFERITEL